MTGKPSAWAASDLTWFKSSYSSSGDGNDCIEVAAIPGTGTVHVRDSKNAHGPRLAVGGPAWADFVAHASGS